MKILIISDSHDNIPNLKKALALAKKEKVGSLLHCGDVASTATLKFIEENFSGRIFLVFGNADNEREKILRIGGSSNRQTKIFPESAALKIGGLAIAISHYPAKAKILAKSQQYDFVFYGHNHRPWVEIMGETILANPGPLDNSFPTPTCAILNTKTKKLELKILK